MSHICREALMWKLTIPKIFCLSKFLLRILSDFDGFPESPAVRRASLTISALQAVFVKPVRHRENKRDRKRTSNRSRRRKIPFPTYKIFSESNTYWIVLWGGVKKNQRRALACVVCCVLCSMHLICYWFHPNAVHNNVKHRGKKPCCVDWSF